MGAGEGALIPKSGEGALRSIGGALIRGGGGCANSRIYAITHSVPDWRPVPVRDAIKL